MPNSCTNVGPLIRKYIPWYEKIMYEKLVKIRVIHSVWVMNNLAWNYHCGSTGGFIRRLELGWVLFRYTTVD